MQYLILLSALLSLITAVLAQDVDTGIEGGEEAMAESVEHSDRIVGDTELDADEENTGFSAAAA